MPVLSESGDGRVGVVGVVVGLRAPMLGPVDGRIIDGERWIAERLTFLRERLAAQPSADERRAIEAEIEVLSKERGISLGGLRAGGLGRRLRGKK